MKICIITLATQKKLDKVFLKQNPHTIMCEDFVGADVTDKIVSNFKYI